MHNNSNGNNNVVPWTEDLLESLRQVLLLGFEAHHNVGKCLLMYVWETKQPNLTHNRKWQGFFFFPHFNSGPN